MSRYFALLLIFAVYGLFAEDKELSIYRVTKTCGFFDYYIFAFAPSGDVHLTCRLEPFFRNRFDAPVFFETWLVDRGAVDNFLSAIDDADKNRKYFHSPYYKYGEHRGYVQTEALSAALSALDREIYRQIFIDVEAASVAGKLKSYVSFIRILERSGVDAVVMDKALEILRSAEDEVRKILEPILNSVDTDE